MVDWDRVHSHSFDYCKVIESFLSTWGSRVWKMTFNGDWPHHNSVIPVCVPKENLVENWLWMLSEELLNWDGTLVEIWGGHTADNRQVTHTLTTTHHCQIKEKDPYGMLIGCSEKISCVQSWLAVWTKLEYEKKAWEDLFSIHDDFG